MPTYEFTARDATGRIIKGNLVAENISAGKVKLRNLGYFVSSFLEKKTSSVAEASQAKAKQKDSGKLAKVKLNSVIAFCQQLGDMLQAGIPIVECFSSLSVQIEDPGLRNVIIRVRKDIEGGSSFGDALEKYPKIFPQIAISLIKAGEVGGFLVAALQRIVTTLEKQEDLKHKVNSAIVYPIAVLSIAVLVVVFLLIFVIPIFTKIYGEMGGELPLPTKILLNLSDFLRSKWYVLVVGPVGVFVGFKSFKNSAFGKDFLDRIKLKLPLVKMLVRKAVVARFTRTLGALLTSGVPINQALEVTRKIISNIVLLEVIDKIIDNVNKGERVIVAIEKAPIFPASIIQMVRIGEESGNLDTMLNRAADVMEREVDSTVKKLTTLLEPLLTVVLGVIVGFIAVSIYLPMFSMSQMLKE